MVAAEVSPPARRRGLTLIEVLIALGIILALSAIVLPISIWTLRLGALESTRDGVEAVLLQARATARLDGRPVEVRIEGDRVVARWFDPVLGDVLSMSEDAEPSELDAGFEDVTELDKTRIGEPWARRTIPAGVKLLELDDYLLTLAEGDDSDFPFFTDAFDPMLLDQSTKSLRIAVFLPDGGALVGSSVVLLETGGSALTLAIDPWSARPVISPAPVASDLLEDPFEDEDEYEEAEAPSPEPASASDDDAVPEREPPVPLESGEDDEGTSA